MGVVGCYWVLRKLFHPDCTETLANIEPGLDGNEMDLRLQVQERMDVGDKYHDFEFKFGGDGDGDQVKRSTSFPQRARSLIWCVALRPECDTL